MFVTNITFNQITKKSQNLKTQVCFHLVYLLIVQVINMNWIFFTSESPIYHPYHTHSAQLRTTPFDKILKKTSDFNLTKLEILMEFQINRILKLRVVFVNLSVDNI